jgi:diadenosine tetraphosphatase ApaH/serine/threonine PP2A family protein phosphatase
LNYIDDLGVDAIVNLGDVVGYNTNPNECCDIMRQREIPTICGNHDAVACGLEEPWGFNPNALAAAMWTRDALREDNLEWLRNLPENHLTPSFLAVHGAPGDRNRYLLKWEDILPEKSHVEKQGVNLCFFGHTHQPGIFSDNGAYMLDDASQIVVPEEGTYFINAGAVGQPRDGDFRAAFGLFNSETRVFEQIRLNYPVQTCAAKIADSGLPPFLSERLLLGR